MLTCGGRVATQMLVCRQLRNRATSIRSGIPSGDRHDPDGAGLRPALPARGPRRMLAIGLAGLSLISALFLLVGLDTSLWFIRGIMFFCGVAMSLVLVASQAATFSSIKSEEQALPRRCFNTNRQVAASVGVAVLTTVLTEATLT
jgi:MFS family permease